MDGFSWTASAMSAAQSRLDVATTNLANASVDGFHALIARERLTEHGIHVALARGKSGSMRPTGRELDFLCDGHFELVDGRHVSSGSFERSASGTVALNGVALRGNKGPLCFPPGAKLEINGSVTVRGKVIDQCRCVGRVFSGYRASSGVEPASQMVEVLDAERGFETAQKTFLAIDAVRQKISSDLGRPAQ